MAMQLPEIIDPIALADKGAHLSGRLPVASMARLCSMAVDDSPVARTQQFVEISLDFGKKDGARWIQGRASTEIGLRCERCLAPFVHQLAVKIGARLVCAAGDAPSEAEEIALEADDLEIIEVEGSIDLAELVENELILAMPMVPMHAPGDCEAAAVASATIADQTRPHAFAALASLKKDD